MAHFVIIGGGLAAASATETLRDEGFDGDLTVVASEAHPPYQRPPLSKGYLAGAEGLDAVIVHPASWYAENGIDLRLSARATSLDPVGHSVELDGGERLSYDRLLLATGATPRLLPLEGANLDGVMTLRTIDDSDALAAVLRGGGSRLVVIGAGWIGMEAGATARTLGNEVTLLERSAVPLAPAVGEEMGTVFLQLHREHGVDLRTEVNVERIVGTVGRVTGVVVDGETIPADIVLIGVGAAPATQLAAEAGIALGNGVTADSSLRTSAPDVFVAGDIADAFHPVISRHQRSEHWANARGEGSAAARAMLGQRVSYADIPYFFTDQFDLGMELTGYAPLMADAALQIRGDLAAREFIAFWTRGAHVVGGMNVNIWDVNDTIQELIRLGAAVDLEALRDPAVPLDSLMQE